MHIRFTYYGGQGWGNADRRGLIARHFGIPVTRTAVPGDIAWWGANHVAYVERVESADTIVISEMNYDGHNGLRVHEIHRGSAWPSEFIHVAALAGRPGV